MKKRWKKKLKNDIVLKKQKVVRTMWVKSIKLKNFRNYKNEKIELGENINIIYGENAQGKTNIIEAIFLCSMGKSFRTKKEKEMINLKEENCLVEIEYEKSDREGKIKIELASKKNIYINNIKIKKLSELLGKINIVIFKPDDINIIQGDPQNRRRFLDIMISQLRPTYMHTLSLYQKTIEQRNNYLKQIREENKDENMLEIWDEKLADYAIKINKYRNEFIKKIKEKIVKIHKEITNDKEEIEIIYNSDCENKDNYLNLLKQRRKLDIIKGFTTKGVHRDDFEIEINNKNLKIYGSQGQQRTATLSLKLSELNVIYEEIGEYPILLLDDFMSELDKTRRENLIKNIKEKQVIITCTDQIVLENLEYLEYNVKEGKIINKK